MAVPYGNRRFLKEVLEALAKRTEAHREMLAWQERGERAQKELQKLGLDPLTIEELLDVESDEDPSVFYCEREEVPGERCGLPVIKDLAKGDTRKVFCGKHEDSSAEEF